MAWLPGWKHRIKITVDSSKVDAALTYFPTLIHVSASCGKDSQDLTAIFDDIGASYLKMAVTEDDGTTELYVEVEKWDNGTEEGWLHVSLAGWVIASGADTDFYIYYDSTHADNNARVGLTNSVVAESVWDGDFMAVYHMKDGASTSAIYDSTSNDLDGTKKGANEPAEGAGQVGYGQVCDGVDDDIACGDFGNFPNYFEVESLAKGVAENYRNIWCSKLTAVAGDNALRVQFSGDDLLYYVGGVSYVIETLVTGTYYYVVVQADTIADKMYAYLAKTLKVDEAHVNWPATMPTFTMATGWNDIASRHWDGTIDELRVSSANRAKAWHDATYEGLEDNLLSFGSEELVNIGASYQMIGLPGVTIFRT